MNSSVLGCEKSINENEDVRNNVNQAFSLQLKRAVHV